MQYVNELRNAASTLLLIFALAASANAQTDADRAAVERAAMNYLEGFYEGSTDKIRASVHPDVYKFGFSLRDGAYVRHPMSFEQMLEFAIDVRESGEFPADDAPKSVEILDILDKTAVAKVYAWWGSDYMTLVKSDGVWKIVQVLWQTPPPD